MRKEKQRKKQQGTCMMSCAFELPASLPEEELAVTFKLELHAKAEARYRSIKWQCNITQR